MFPKRFFLKVSIFMFLSCKAQIGKNDINIKQLDSLFSNLSKQKFSGKEIYQGYFYQAISGQPNRSEIEKKYYEDSVFTTFHNALSKSDSYEVLSLADAKREFGSKQIVNDYYYESQKNLIYTLLLKDKQKSLSDVYYILMKNGKVVSLMPSTQDKKLFWWR